MRLKSTNSVNSLHTWRGHKHLVNAAHWCPSHAPSQGKKLDIQCKLKLCQTYNQTAKEKLKVPANRREENWKTGRASGWTSSCTAAELSPLMNGGCALMILLFCVMQIHGSWAHSKRCKELETCFPMGCHRRPHPRSQTPCFSGLIGPLIDCWTTLYFIRAEWGVCVSGGGASASADVHDWLLIARNLRPAGRNRQAIWPPMSH